jgi:hypothetical protein
MRFARDFRWAYFWEGRCCLRLVRSQRFQLSRCTSPVLPSALNLR